MRFLGLFIFFILDELTALNDRVSEAVLDKEVSEGADRHTSLNLLFVDTRLTPMNRRLPKFLHLLSLDEEFMTHQLVHRKGETVIHHRLLVGESMSRNHLVVLQEFLRLVLEGLLV